MEYSDNDMYAFLHGEGCDGDDPRLGLLDTWLPDYLRRTRKQAEKIDASAAVEAYRAERAALIAAWEADHAREVGRP